MRLFLRMVPGVFLAFVLFACAPATQKAAPGVSPAQETATPSSGVKGNLPVPLATSRGDKLEASPPTSVKYGAGRPVLVEFFRFT
jgi:hypothetical protein